MSQGILFYCLRFDIFSILFGKNSMKTKIIDIFGIIFAKNINLDFDVG